MLQDMNLLKYAVFLKTVELGSFTRASHALNYSQSGISRMIADLEKQWGLCLLERNKTGVRLSADGARILPYIENLCQAYDRMQEEAAQIMGLESGLIRIATFSSVATHWLPNIIKEFKKDYPAIDYEILLGSYQEIEQWVRDGRADCGFLVLTGATELETTILYEDRLLAVLPESHPLARLEQIPLALLCSDSFMLLKISGNEEVPALFARYGLSPKVNFVTWDDYAIMSMVENGLGISILSELILKRIPYKVALRQIAEPAYRTIAFVTPGKAALSASTKKFMTYLKYRSS